MEILKVGKVFTVFLECLEISEKEKVNRIVSRTAEVNLRNDLSPMNSEILFYKILFVSNDWVNI